MLTKRQENILKLIVMKYIELAKPVSSNLICKKLKCSSATVRNEMVELENLGLDIPFFLKLKNELISLGIDVGNISKLEDLEDYLCR